MLLDSNIIIYAVQDGNAELWELVEEQGSAASIVSYIEAMGYHSLGDGERLGLDDLFQNLEILPLNNVIADRAVELRQQRRMGLGDAIIAATALIHGLALLTHNTQDFRWIDDLDLRDPMEQQA